MLFDLISSSQDTVPKSSLKSIQYNNSRGYQKVEMPSFHILYNIWTLGSELFVRNDSRLCGFFIFVWTYLRISHQSQIEKIALKILTLAFQNINRLWIYIILKFQMWHDLHGANTAGLETSCDIMDGAPVTRLCDQTTKRNDRGK